MPDYPPSARLNLLTLERNIPAAATLELTRRCVLNCRHCYLSETPGRGEPGPELGTAQWKDVLGQLAGAGGLYITFTGGEPLLRPDLAELCSHAKKLRFDVRVFSTGLGLTAKLAARFKKAGVSGFEISVYGRLAVHDSITGMGGSFRRSLAAARLVKKSGMGVRLKMPLMSVNSGQADWLKKMAAAEGFEAAFDPVITPSNDGNQDALALRPSVSQLSRAIKLLGTHFHPPLPLPASFDLLCGAGRNVCAIGPGGDLSPCLQIPVKLGNLIETPFKTLWARAPWLKKWRELKTSDLKECRNCAYISACNRCPGLSFVENGDILAPNKPACEIAKITHELAAGRPAAGYRRSHGKPGSKAAVQAFSALCPKS